MSENKETPQAPGDEQKTKQSERSSSGGGGGGGGRERSRRRHHQPQQSQQRRPEASLNMDELRELVELIAEHGFTDFELEREGFRVRLGRELAPQMPAPSMPSAQTSTHAVGQTSAPATATSAAASQSSTGGATQSSSGSPPPDGMSEEGAAAAVADEENLHIITSPIVGTFYRSPSPTADVFVRIGSHINADTIVCIIEAMKLMNEIPAETSGEVVKIYVENGQPVEYGQPLFGIKK